MRRKLIVVSLLAAPMMLGAQQMTDTTFHTISLADALRLATENNVSNITAANSVRLANNSVRSARAEWYPSLSASTNQSINQGDRLGPSNNLIPIASKWAYTTSLQSAMTVYDGGRTRADVRTQQSNVAQQQANQINTEFNISFNVKQAYNAALAARESEAAARAQLATAQLQLQTSIAKVNAGAATVSDSLRGIVAVGNAQLALLQAQSNLRTQSANLTRFVGTNYFVTADPADTTDHSMAPVDSATIMAMALNGPTIRAADAAVNSANAAERSAKAAYFPQISLSGSIGGSGTNAFYGVPGLRGDNVFPYSKSLGIQASLPIFNRYQRENSIASAQISYDNAQALARDARLAAQQNVVTGFAALRNAEESIRVNQTNVQASQEDLRVVQQRYNLGASTLLDVLTSQQALATAQQQLIQARLNYRNARAQLEQAIGQNLP
ncbi:MAG TPA: TolC family protein [Gemmatimonadaceae bacterium]|nr:TolC family protein [Gemmatimonadaceae bacterium]